ncbi:MAG: heparinase II/III family protein [bacterium]|nr:heparinase II/III family protein [bacterium]
MLSQKYSESRVQTMLIAQDQWQPFPKSANRPGWEGLPDAVKRAQVARGEERLGFEWPALPATRFLDYARDGNRTRYEALTFGRRNALADLVIAECVENKGRFLDDILNGVWCICEESFWGVPAHISAQKAGKGLPDTAEPIVDLFAAETSELLAWTVYLLGDPLSALSPLVVPRVAREMQTRILTPLFERDDFGWMGFSGNRVNNWNPWIVSNWLTSNLLMEPDPDRRSAATHKAMRTVDNFIDPYPADGGCDEGPGYWGRAGASLYDCLEWLYSATGGQINVYDEPVAQNIGKFIYRVQIADRYFINFADASPMVTPAFAVTYGYGKRIQDPDMMAIGAWAAQSQNVGEKGVSEGFGSMGRALPALFAISEVLKADAAPPLPRDVFLDEIEVFVARDTKGSTEGFFVGAKGGHNAESHNHNDIGHVVVSIDGKPVLVDAGVEAYTAKTFSSERYSIWTMHSGYHTLPTINGQLQIPGRIYSAQGIEYKYDIAARDVHYHCDEGSATFSLDIANAYAPEAEINSYQRKVTLNRGKEIVLEDRYNLKKVTGGLSLNMLTACAVKKGAPGILALKETELADGRTSGSATLHFDGTLFDVAIETKAIEDNRLKTIWGKQLTRIVFTVKSPQTQGGFTLRLTR